MFSSDITEVLDGSAVCVECLDDHYWRCPACDGWNRDGDACARGCGADRCRCPSCWRPIHGYEYKPTPIFHGVGPLFLGPEIEIETPYVLRDECADIAVDCLGSLGYLKEDGSLNYGFEIVTHPMSYQWAIDNFPWEMLTRLRESGCSTPETTGMHVHASRAGFSSACHTYRWMKFIYRNQRHVTALARRSAPGYAAFTEDDRRAVKEYAKGARGARYRAINTRNRDTFELRIFASSLDLAEVKAALAFTASSIEYTRELTAAAIARDGGWTWPAFVEWLADRPAYQPLTEQLEALQCVC